MKSFIDQQFLLYNATGEYLYHQVAADLPIIDYHNHLNPVHLAENKQFSNLTELWIGEDPYKHRAMRINGIPENGITGNAGDREKFNNWVETYPYTVGNPLYHWSCLELKKVFGIEQPLHAGNAAEVWDITHAALTSPGFGAMDLLQRWNVAMVCTSDDLTDDTSYHQRASLLHPGTTILPSLRADAIVGIDKPGFKDWLKKLETLTGTTIAALEDYQLIIEQRLQLMAAAGCVLSDHAIDPDFIFEPVSQQQASGLFRQLITRNELSEADTVGLQSYLLGFLGRAYAALGWTMQLHIGAQRSTSTRLRNLAGPAGGYAGIGKACNINMLCKLLDALEKEEGLPTTILYTLNPADNAAFATLTGSYAADGVPGKIQFGPAWWYNDHYEGITRHLVDLSAYGLLSRFIGMTTDSRSILSLSRHEYFRRILCNLLGKWVEEKKLPEEETLLKRLIEDICCHNARRILTIKK